MTRFARTNPNAIVPSTMRTAACIAAIALCLPTARPSLLDDTGPLPVIERVSAALVALQRGASW